MRLRQRKRPCFTCTPAIQTGQPLQDPDLFAQFLPRIKQSCDAIVNITTVGGLGMTLEDQLAPAKRFRPEVCSINMGSVNFNIRARPGRFRTGSLIGKSHIWR
ncbi:MULTISPECIES: 3-keto-5-aminohexanoate cleavage protein [Sphingobium]|uniref:3-keto-5-aminohexanoate cleavage protein n=1 Tax=Sphingobium sp. MI1205 TaxID=407020 RepID=UPI000783A792